MKSKLSGSISGLCVLSNKKQFNKVPNPDVARNSCLFALVSIHVTAVVLVL